jgi:hypothetical protein
MVLPVPRAPAFAGEFADAIDGARVHHRLLRRVVLRRARAERGDRARPEDALQLVRARHFEHVEQALHVQVPGPHRMLLAARGEGRREVIDLRDGVALDDLRQRADVGAVKRFVREAGQLALRREVAGDDGVIAVRMCERGGEFGADLAVGADDEDSGLRNVTHFTNPSSWPALANAATAVSRCCRSCTALICTRMRAWPLGTTGKKKPTT